MCGLRQTDFKTVFRKLRSNSDNLESRDLDSQNDNRHL